MFVECQYPVATISTALAIPFQSNLVLKNAGISAVRFADYASEMSAAPSDKSLGYFQACASRTLVASRFVPSMSFETVSSVGAPRDRNVGTPGERDTGRCSRTEHGARKIGIYLVLVCSNPRLFACICG
jgi:hypothetical protein